MYNMYRLCVDYNIIVVRALAPAPLPRLDDIRVPAPPPTCVPAGNHQPWDLLGRRRVDPAAPVRDQAPGGIHRLEPRVELRPDLPRQLPPHPSPV